MNPNIRLSTETQKDYKERLRGLSKEQHLVRVLFNRGTYIKAKHGDLGLSDRSKPKKARKMPAIGKFAEPRARKAAAGRVSWPNSPDQIAQSRPVIVLRPIMVIKLAYGVKRAQLLSVVKSLGQQPKHDLDAFARRSV